MESVIPPLKMPSIMLLFMKLSLGSFGFRFNTSVSDGSDIKEDVAARSIKSSRIIICTGENGRGILKSTGTKNDIMSPTLQDRQYFTHFDKLSNSLLPSFMASIHVHHIYPVI